MRGCRRWGRGGRGGLGGGRGRIEGEEEEGGGRKGWGCGVCVAGGTTNSGSCLRGSAGWV